MGTLAELQKASWLRWGQGKARVPGVQSFADCDLRQVTQPSELYIHHQQNGSLSLPQDLPTSWATLYVPPGNPANIEVLQEFCIYKDQVQ